MPAFPYAKLLVSLAGGALQSGGITAAFGQSVQLSSEDTAHPQAFRYEIYSYPPGFACPSGWSTDASGNYYYAGGATPPAFTLPASHGSWGDWLLRLTINNGDPGTSGLPASQFVDISTAIRLVSDAGVTDTAFLAGTQFNAREGAVFDLKAALRLLAIGLGAGFGTAAIADNSITYAKVQQVPTDTVLGRDAAGTGNITALSLTNGLAFTGSDSFGIANAGVTYARIQDVSAQARLLGRGGASGVGSPEELTVGGGLEFNATQVRLSALTGDVTNAAGGGATAIGANKVTLPMMAQLADQRILGNISGGTANVAALTATQATAFLNVGTTALKGLVAPPVTATGKFYRDDHTWASPAGSFTGPVSGTDDGKLTYALTGALAYASAIKTDGTYLAFGVSAATLTIGLQRVPHASHVLAGLGSDGTTNYDLAQWGVGTNNRLLLGSSTVPLTELQGKQLRLTASAQSATALTPTIAFTGGAHTTLTASTEVNDVLVDLGQTKQWATGALTTQRALRVLAPTYAFVGDSTITTGATVAISGAPVAGTHTLAITQSLALWIESGGIGYGSSAALTGLNRYAHNSLVAVGRKGDGSADVPLATWGATTDQLTLGADNAASVYAYALTTFGVRLGGATEFTFSTTQLDCNGNNIVNLTALNGVRVTVGVLGTALPDTNGTTLSVAGGSVYEQTTAFTANRSVALAITGATTAEVISIKRHVTDGFTLTITDEVGNPLYTFPAGEKRTAEFQFNTSVASKFARIGHTKIA